MKVWVGYECYDNGCDIFRVVEVIFGSEEAAKDWKYGVFPTEYSWREYEECEVKND